MKKTLLKLLTGLTAVSLTVAQPVSVLASETDGAGCEQTEQNNQEFGKSNDQISDGGNNDSNTDDSASNDGAEVTGDAAGNDSAAVADGVDNTDDTIEPTENVGAEENKAIDTTQQTGGANSDLIGEAEQSDGKQLEGTSDDEQIADSEQTDNPIEETTEGEKETADQSPSNSDMEVANSAEKASDANTVTTDDSQSGANVASDIAKYDESAEEKKDDAGEGKVNAAEETEMTAVNDIDSESALATNSDNAVLSQMMTESLSEDNTTRSVDDQQATCVAAVTKKSGTQYYNTLQEAIDAADEDDTTITLVKEVKENVIISGKDVKNFVLDLCGKTITSVENAAKACIDIVGSKVTIRNTGAEKNEDGTLKNASVTGSTASGIKISQSSVDLFGLLIKGNVGSLGGGVQASDSELNITGTTFADNKATGVNAHGGAIATYKGELNIDGSTFTGNSADTNGGAVYTREADNVNISNSDFSANKAYNGGAYASETSQAPYDTTTEVKITNVTICGNEATNLGGGLCFNGYDSASGVSFLSGKGKNHSVTVTASTISGNAAGQQGGGVLAYGADLTIDGVIDNNTAIYGGGVFSFHSDVKIGNGTVISGNTALSYGGGLYSSFDTSYKMNGVTVDDNTATVNYGGGVFTYGTQGVEVLNSSIKNNKARLGGGLAAYASSVNMSGSFVTGNKGIIYTDPNGTAWNASGAGILVCSKGVVNLVNTAVTGNGDENTSTGGAAAVYSGSKLTADANTTIMNNSAVLGGGLYISGEATIFNGAKLYNNTAVAAGDDVYLAPGAAITLTPVGKKWVLNDGYGHIIDGWYIDAKDARWSETVAKGLEGYLAEGVTITLNKDGSYTIKVTANAKSGFALKAAHSPIKPTPNTPSTPAGTDGATATAADVHAVLGVVRTPEVVENVIEESAVLGVERTSAVLGALRGRGTGDESHMGAWGVVSLASLVGAGVFFARKKKED